MKEITIIIKWVSHYRLPFYEGLKIHLEDRGIKLQLIYGEPTSQVDLKKNDWVDVPWGIKVPNTEILGKKLIWQPVLSYLVNSDLIIVEQANKLLVNYWLQIKCSFSRQKLAFWGHGKNFQASNSVLSNIKEKVKESLMHQVDWWFAYNNLCAVEIAKTGYSDKNITRVENAIDTSRIKKINSKFSDQDVFHFKSKLGINTDCIAVFCGGMFQHKRLSFLLDSAIAIKEKNPEFVLVFIGAGIEQSLVEDVAQQFSWVHYLGPLFEEEKVLAMKMAQVYLMPGLVGLGVLDAFALELPVITTKYQYHSPEISYVEHKKNGLIADNDMPSFVNAVTEVLSNKVLMEQLKKGCNESSSIYTIDNMVKNFSNGVFECLDK